MNKWQAQYNFWSSFGIPAFDAASVPKDDYPYITYTGTNGDFDTDTPTTVSIWTRSTSWAEADRLSDEIQEALSSGGVVVPYDDGIIWITMGSPFAQNMGDPNDDLIRRKILNVTLHFC